MFLRLPIAVELPLQWRMRVFLRLPIAVELPLQWRMRAFLRLPAVVDLLSRDVSDDTPPRAHCQLPIIHMN